MELVGLKGFEKRHIRNQLSGGQRQRGSDGGESLGAETRNCSSPDEPLAAIGPQKYRQELFEAGPGDTRVGITSIFVTHDQDEVPRLADADHHNQP
ncbi:MAG: hypothetical protein ACLVCH_13850 [Roseburia inulinivorans]